MRRGPIRPNSGAPGPVIISKIVYIPAYRGPGSMVLGERGRRGIGTFTKKHQMEGGFEPDCLSFVYLYLFRFVFVTYVNRKRCKRAVSRQQPSHWLIRFNVEGKNSLQRRRGSGGKRDRITEVWKIPQATRMALLVGQSLEDYCTISTKCRVFKSRRNYKNFSEYCRS